MHVLSVIQVQDRLRWVLVSYDKTVVIECMEESPSIPDEIRSIKNLKIVTGLEGTAVLRRDLKIPLRGAGTVRAALPFQLEPLLPFPLDQSLVYPQLHEMKKETFVVAWATTQMAVKSHLEKWQSLGIDPDLVSSETLALARWARYFFPNESELIVVHEKIGIAIDHNRVVCAMESPDPARLKFFLKQKYPLFKWIEAGPTPESWAFAPVIGLALEAFQKQPCQFRPHSFPSMRQKKHERFLMKTTLFAGLGLTLATFLASAAILHYQESKLKNQIALFHKMPPTSLEQSVHQLRDFIVKETKTSPPVFNHPLAREVLSWFSTLTAPVEINHFEYELQSANRIQVSLDFQAATSADADLFIKQLQQSPTFVESTPELKWTSHPHGYKLSFHLRKSS